MKNAVLTKEGTPQNGKAILPHKPFSLVHRLQSEINRLFDDFNQGFGHLRNNWLEPLSECQAKVDVKDAGNEIIVTAEVPGVEMKDLEITATPHYVTIAGEKKYEKEQKNNGYYQMEREYGYFRRVLPLPCEIDKEKADAVFKDGVLTLTLPKTKAALENEHKVTVKAG